MQCIYSSSYGTSEALYWYERYTGMSDERPKFNTQHKKPSGQLETSLHIVRVHHPTYYHYREQSMLSLES